MKIRCFSAVDFSKPLTDAIDTVAKFFARRASSSVISLRWEKKENIHLTLNFFGEIEQTLLTHIIVETKRRVALYTEPVALKIGGLGVFPNMHSPRVLWMGCEDEGDRLTAIQKLIRNIAEETGNGAVECEKREFSPHITIGRIREIRSVSQFAEVMQKFNAEKNFSKIERVGTISFMQSILRPQGSVYSLIEEIPIVQT